MGDNKEPKFVVALMSCDGRPLGYLKYISSYYTKVDSTYNIAEAKQYVKAETALRNGELASQMTHGGLLYKVVNC